MSGSGLGLTGGSPDETGSPVIDLDLVEERHITLALGLESHPEDLTGSDTWGPWSAFRIFDFLQNGFQRNGRRILAGLTGFNRASDTEADYFSAAQNVHYFITIVKSKDALKTALQTPGIHVIYDGHARYGRGPALHPYSGTAPQGGEMWEDGTGDDNGIFRMGYPYVPVALIDFEQALARDDGLNYERHGFYTFRPVRGDQPPPPREEILPEGRRFLRHPDARRSLSRITLPPALRPHVAPGFESSDDTYWGTLAEGRERHLLLHANWTGSHAGRFDLGATELRCKVFCHFGCSTRKHCWEIVRGTEYKGWRRDNPPTDRFAYFTSAASDPKVTPLWLYGLFTYPNRNNWQSWWLSLERAKSWANTKLSRAPFTDSYRIY